MRRALLWLLLAAVSLPALADHPRRLLDWEDMSAPPGSWPPSTLAFAGGILYANGGREPQGRNPGVYRYDARADAWAPHGALDGAVRWLAADGDTLYASVGDWKAAGVFRTTRHGVWAKLMPLPDNSRFVGVVDGVGYARVGGPRPELRALDFSRSSSATVHMRLSSPDFHRVRTRAHGDGFTLSLLTRDGDIFGRTDHDVRWSVARYGPPGFALRGSVGDAVATTEGVFYAVEGESEVWYTQNRGLGGATPVDFAGTMHSKAHLATVEDGVLVWGREGWRPKNDGLPTLNVRAVVASAHGGRRATIYAAMDSSGVYARPPGSPAWTAMDRGLDNPRARSLTTDGSAVTLGTADGGLYRWDWDADDIRWEAYPAPVPGGDVRGIAVTPDAIYAVTPAGAFEAERSGGEWTPLSITLSAGKALASAADGAYVAADSGQVFRNREGSDVWDVLDPELRYGSVRAMAVADVAVYVATFYGVFRHSEAERGWVRVAEGGITEDGVIDSNDTRHGGGFTHWVFSDLAIGDGFIYGALQNRLVRARLP